MTITVGSVGIGTAKKFLHDRLPRTVLQRCLSSGVKGCLVRELRSSEELYIFLQNLLISVPKGFKTVVDARGLLRARCALRIRGL